ncbi:MAG: alpha-1,2-fucosyltransferase [Synergistaceae bacterium]|jgi:hypothetical protein|nr:alpha-1,2-fucosyltransferase [Synergistaceae bacterium]
MKSPLKTAYRSFVAPIARKVIKASRRDFQRAIVVPLDGGLGLQMWRYAIGRAARDASNLPVLYDASRFEGGISGLEGVFPAIDPQKAPDALARIYKRYFFTGDPGGDPMVCDASLLSSNEPRYLGGRYLNAAYIGGQGDALLEEFAFGPILSDESRYIFSSIYMEDLPVAVHFAPGTVSERYFSVAARTMSERLAPAKPVFFVFIAKDAKGVDILSDTGLEFVYVDWDQGSEPVRMYLMSRCKHFIISNSLFSWWPAWLSRELSDKIVMTPDKWLPESRKADAGAMTLPGWTVLSGE